MEGNIYINGYIGSTPISEGVELIDVMQQVKRQPNATSFNVFVNSKGGSVQTGFDIYNYLRSLQVPITTIGQGYVASIATIIFMAGDTRKREPNTKFMIHLPKGDMGGGGTADEIEAFAKSVRDAENKLLTFYSERMGFDKESIKPLLMNETWLTDEQTKDFGITNAEPLEIVASAYFNLNSNNKMNKEEKQSLLDTFNNGIDKIMNAISGKKILNIVLQDANGVSIEFPDVMEGEQIPLETKGLADGAPAEGEYLMPDGNTYVFSAGVLTEIVEAQNEDDDSEDMQAILAENEALKKQLADKEIEASAQAEKIVNMAKDLKKFKSTIVSKLDIDEKTEAKKEEQPTKRKLLK